MQRKIGIVSDNMKMSAVNSFYHHRGICQVVLGEQFEYLT